MEAAAANHGEFVSALSQYVNEWKDAGLISGREKGKIISCVAHADITSGGNGNGNGKGNDDGKGK